MQYNGLTIIIHVSFIKLEERSTIYLIYTHPRLKHLHSKFFRICSIDIRMTFKMLPRLDAFSLPIHSLQNIHIHILARIS